MLNREDFTKLVDAFREIHEFMDCVPGHSRGRKFVCHHNSYLIFRFLKQLNYPVRWVSGVYRCADGTSLIHHSWIAVVHDGNPMMIFEYDPGQLKAGGGYENDPMPGADPLGLEIGPFAALFVDPMLVEIPDDLSEVSWIVASKEVLLRYVRNVARTPEIDLDDLNQIAADAIKDYAYLKKSESEGNVTTTD